MLAALVVAVALAGLTGAFLRRPCAFLDAALRAVRRSAKLATRRLRAAEHDIAYLDGERGEPLVLLHGFAANKDHWPPIAKLLNARFRIIAPDIPGFGDSERRPDLRYAIDDQVKRLHDFLQRLQLGRIHLGGNSMGGQLAAAYAARYPEEVRSLWLIAPAGVQTAEPSELQKLMARGENPLLVRGTADFARLVQLSFSRPPYIPRPFLRCLMERAATDRPFNEKIFSDWLGKPAWLEERVAGLAIPTLVLWGAEDRLLHVSGAEILGRLIPGSRVAVLAATGHVPMVERPAETARHFLEFQQGLQ